MNDLDSNVVERINIYIFLKVKKHSHYRPVKALRIPGD
jgi:hypothetical protein